MRMRFALVDAKIPNSTENTVATYTPYVSTAYSLASLAFNNGLGYPCFSMMKEAYTTSNMYYQYNNYMNAHFPAISLPDPVAGK
jgi:hypothetical protein